MLVQPIAKPVVRPVSDGANPSVQLTPKPQPKRRTRLAVIGPEVQELLFTPLQ